MLGVAEEVVEVVVGRLVGQEVQPHPHNVHGKQVVEPWQQHRGQKVIFQMSVIA